MADTFKVILKDEWFIHFTRPEYADLILKSKKILASKSTSVAGEAFAISTSFGIFSPYLPMDIYKGDDSSYVAILFQTSVKPSDIGIGQVVWNKDFSIKKAKKIKFSQAKKDLDYKRVRAVGVPTSGSSVIKYI